MKISVAPEVSARGIRSEGCSVQIADGDAEIALLELALDLEIELLREIASQVDARAAQTKTIFVCAGAFDEATLKCGNIAALILRLDESAKCELGLRRAGNNINWLFSSVVTLFSTYDFPSPLSLVVFFSLEAGVEGCCCFKLLTSFSSSALRFCSNSTARSSFSRRAESDISAIRG